MFPDDNPYRSPQPFGGREAGDVEHPPRGSLDAVQVEQPITIRFCWTADDLLQGYRYHFRHTCRPPFRLGLHFILAMALLGGTLGCLTSTGTDFVISVGVLLGGIYWYALRPLERRWMVRRQFAKRPDNNQDIEWQIALDKITANSSLGHSQFSWKAIAKVVCTPSGLMLYPIDQVFHWLPRRGFANDGEFERAAEIAKSKVQRIYRVA